MELAVPSNFAGTYTYAGLPSAAAASGKMAIASDIGVAPGMLLISDGTRWKPLGLQCLARSGVLAAVTGTLSETALATVAVPAGLMGVSGGLLIYTSWSHTNSANTKTMRVRLGGLAGTVHAGLAATTLASTSDARRIRNRASASSQVGSQAAAGFAFVSTTSTPIVTGAIDTSVAQDVSLTGTLTNTGESVTLESYEVWVSP
jgi:hypothetical protein